MTEPEFRPGLRLSPLDAAALAAGAVGAILAGREIPVAGLVVAFAVGHFFLFCNVFRFERASELQWAALFVALSAATITFGIPGWPATFVLSLGATVFLVVRELRKPGYHGIGWRRVNPGLHEWWRDRRGR